MHISFTCLKGKYGMLVVSIKILTFTHICSPFKAIGPVFLLNTPCSLMVPFFCHWSSWTSPATIVWTVLYIRYDFPRSQCCLFGSTVFKEWMTFFGGTMTLKANTGRKSKFWKWIDLHFLICLSPAVLASPRTPVIYLLSLGSPFLQARLPGSPDLR